LFRLPVNVPRSKFSVANGPGRIIVLLKARSLATDEIPEFKLPDRTPWLVNEIEIESAKAAGTTKTATSMAHSNRRDFIFPTPE
jgi:hypothetical protein